MKTNSPGGLPGKAAALPVAPGSFLGWLHALWRNSAANARRLRRESGLFFSNRMARAGLLIILGFALLAVLHPLLMGTVWPKGIYDPVVGYDTAVAPWPAGPAPGHPLGVDALGRDILSMLMYATRATFGIAITAGLSTAVIGLLLGATSAYFRGPLDTLLSHISDAFFLVPAPVILAILGARFFDDLTSIRFGLIYGLIAGAGGAAIVVRAQALTIMTRPYVEAARVSGAGAAHIIFHHLIPHLLPLAAIHMMLAVTGAVITDGFIHWFGLRYVRLNWGAMIYYAVTFLRFQVTTTIPWAQILVPTLALSLFAAAFYFVARGIQEVSDPFLHRR